MSQETITAKNFFSSHGLHLSNDWLESCIQWCHEQNHSGPLNTDTLHKQVYEQWLLLDLRETEVPVLPPNLSQEKKLMLNNNYYLQMMYVIDISRPKHWQLQRIRNSNNMIRMSDLEYEQCSSKRVLQLTLTDGVQEVQAIELEPIKSLNLNLTPGVKVEINGPVMVRRGQILLKEKNIKILGGEVEELLVPNAAENVIARDLGLPENPNPRSIQDNEILNSNNDEISVYSGFQSSNKKISQIDDKRDINYTKVKETKSKESNQYKSIQESNDKKLLKEELLLKDEELFFADENFISNMTNNSGTNGSRNNCKSSVKNCPEPIKNEFEMEDDDIFENMDIDAHLDFVDSTLLKQESNNTKNKVISIKDLQKQKKVGQTFRINAKFKFVLDRLVLKENKWHLKILIGDDSDDLVVLVHTDLVSQLSGLTATEAINEKRKVSNNDELAVQKMMKAVIKMKDKISSLNGELIIKYLNDEELPFIMEIF